MVAPSISGMPGDPFVPAVPMISQAPQVEQVIILPSRATSSLWSLSRLDLLL